MVHRPDASALRSGALALLLAACSSSTAAVSQTELCHDRAGFAGREIWLVPQINPASILPASVLSAAGSTPCPGLSCCMVVPYLAQFDCGDALVVIAPASLGDGSEERYPAELERTLECAGANDGTLAGGGSCRPACPNDTPNLLQVRGLRGVLAANETRVAGGGFGRPLFVFSVREVILSQAPDAGFLSFPDGAI
jgi:hypothetical protein